MSALDRLEGDERYVLFAGCEAAVPALGPRFTVLQVRSAGYSPAEHFELPLAALRAGVDLYHSPHYVLPWLMPCPSVVTIHDVIHLRYPEHLGRPLAVLAARLLGYVEVLQ